MAIITFAEAGITEETFLDPEKIKEIKEKYSAFKVVLPTRLPTRYTAPDGSEKFHMKTTYYEHQRFKLMGLEPAKRAAGAVNVVFSHPTDEKSQIVLTPKDLLKKMAIVDGSEAEAIPPITPASSFPDDGRDDLAPDDGLKEALKAIKSPIEADKLKEVVNGRKKEARITI